MKYATPNQFPRRVLLVVTGMSPQVVTETLYALVTDQDFVPTEVRVITTLNGKVKVRHGLLGEGGVGQGGHFAQFCLDYGLVGDIAFPESHIALIHSQNGEPLPDIRTPEENRDAADSIVQLVQDLCRDPHCALHVSIAGGRKTMGFFVGYALSLFARAQDRLSHVLVSEPYENNPAFYYPPPVSRLIPDYHGNELDASLAKVMLAEIPLVRLRDGLSDALLSGAVGYSDAVAQAQGVQAPATLQFDCAKRQIICGSTPVTLPPVLFALLLWFADARIAGVSPLDLDDPIQAQNYLQHYASVEGSASASYEKAERSIRTSTHDGCLPPYFRPLISRLNRLFTEGLGVARAQAFLVETYAKRPRSRYGLSLPPERITLPTALELAQVVRRKKG
mgnify:FL=1